MTFEQIEVGSKYYAILKIIFFVAIFLVVAINILATTYAVDEFLPGTNNVSNVNWGLELTDDDLNESEELEDEKLHVEESDEYYDNE